MKYRVRIVFNAPVDRCHPFTSIDYDTLEEAEQIIADMQPAIVHAVSVTIQQGMSEQHGRVLRWETLSSLERGVVRP